MKVSVDQFARDIIEIELMSERELANSLEALRADGRPEEIETLCRQLVERGKLTKYQAKTILEGKASELVFGEYIILKKIGEGGMGHVFKAVHRHMERLAAIKVLPPKSLDSPSAVKRFHQEVKVAAKLNHHNIVATYDASEQSGIRYLVMEYVDGRDLSVLIRKGGPMPVSQALDYVLQAARGLEYAHGKGIVHRDIKPANLLLDPEGRIKILDMGLARVNKTENLAISATLEERLTKRGQMLGTVDYMSPEQAEDTRAADRRSDIYSLGCTLYRLLTAKPVYDGDTAIMKLMAHCEAEIPSLDKELPEVSSKLNETFMKMLAKKPENRYQSMTEVIAALQECLALEQSSSPPPSDWSFSSTSTDSSPTAVRREGSQVNSTLTERVTATDSESTVKVHESRTVAESKTPAATEELAPDGARPSVSARRGESWLWLAIGGAVVAAVAVLLYAVFG